MKWYRGWLNSATIQIHLFMKRGAISTFTKIWNTSTLENNSKMMKWNHSESLWKQQTMKKASWQKYWFVKSKCAKILSKKKSIWFMKCVFATWFYNLVNAIFTVITVRQYHENEKWWLLEKLKLVKINSNHNIKWQSYFSKWKLTDDNQGRGPRCSSKAYLEFYLRLAYVDFSYYFLKYNKFMSPKDNATFTKYFYFFLLAQRKFSRHLS